MHIHVYIYIHIQNVQSSCSHTLSFFNLGFRMRWERFAPGPVQAVTILPSKKDHVSKQPRKKGRVPRDPNLPPPKRGRPPKIRNPPETQQASGQGEQQIFAEKSSVASIAVPPQVAAEVPEPPRPSAVATPAQPPPPGRATFAGRTESGSDEYQTTWKDRRALYYKYVPAEHWKDHLERQFWTLCSSCGNNEEGLNQFLEKIGAKKQPESTDSAAAAPKARAKAKAKASSKKPAAKIPGRGRGHGRGRAGKGKAACR